MKRASSQQPTRITRFDGGLEFQRIGWAILIGLGLIIPGVASAFLIEIDTQSGDLTDRNDVFSAISSFSIQIEVLGPLRTGAFSNPELGDIEFLVSGELDPSTPARMAAPSFRFFAVDDRASLRGQDFYDLGNSLSFEIASDAVLGDGLQVSELVGAGLVFEFDGSEVAQAIGRYHPPLLRLSSDGTGSIRNATNSGDFNPVTMIAVSTTPGDEYIHEFRFDPEVYTLAIPEPSSALLLGVGLIALARRRRRD